jgi:heptosyltransferase II
MTLPALRLLEASGYTPMLTGKRWAEDLMAGMGWRFDPIEGHLTDDISHVRYLSRHVGPRPLGLLFPNSIGSALLFAFGRVRSAGFPTDGRRLFLDKVVPEPPVMHEVKRFFTLAHGAILAWGGTPAWDAVPKSLGLQVLARHEAAVRNLTEKYSLPKRYALLAPVAKGLHHGKVKAWPHFNDLCKPLREAGIEPLVFPSPDEVDAAKAACPDARVLPPTTLGNYAALAKHARLVVANDSGVSHIAAAVGARQITLMGVTDPARTGPWNENAVVLGSEKEGWPEVGTVLDALKKLISEPFPPKAEKKAARDL